LPSPRAIQGLNKEVTNYHVHQMLMTRFGNQKLTTTFTIQPKMLVLLSIATKDMIKHMSTYREVWFMDCTTGEKRNRLVWAEPKSVARSYFFTFRN
jgi:hypothetical protein